MDYYHKCERDFAALLERKNKKFIYQPRFNKYLEIGYTPDFYVIDDGFYEIVGTRQAFSMARTKVLRARKIHELKIVTPDGEKYNYGDANKKNASTRKQIKDKQKIFISIRLGRFLLDNYMEPKELANIINCTPSTVHNWVNNYKIRIWAYKVLKNKKYNIKNYLL